MDDCVWEVLLVLRVARASVRVIVERGGECGRGSARAQD